ncbi:MAG: ArsA family ATPase [Anaerolineae bacterium]|nr:ArsA family ATPase [Anaerolineae bacterium]
MSQTRIILFTGKGGVGKTTISAATALRAAEQGYKTLVMSTDPAHSLADALDHPLGPEPTQVRPNLCGQEFDVYYSIKKYLSNLRELMLGIFKWRGIDRMLAEEMAILPGMEETAAFLWLDLFYRSGDYEVIIIDSAPTGETLKHLTLPQVSQWWLTRALPIQKAGKSIGPMVRRVTGVPLDKGLQELETYYNKLMYIQEIMSNPDICSIRLVLNPERMVIQEALRAYTYLQLYGYPVDAVMVNRILPPNSSEAVFGDYLEAQQRYLAEIADTFAPLPIFHAPHLGREVFGPERLQAIAQELYQQQDPQQIFFRRKPYHFIERNYGYLLTIHLPFLHNDDVSVSQNGDELIIQAKHRRRNLFLPKFLAYYRVTNSQVMDGQLLVRFEKA